MREPPRNQQALAARLRNLADDLGIAEPRLRRTVAHGIAGRIGGQRPRRGRGSQSPAVAVAAFPDREFDGRLRWTIWQDWGKLWASGGRQQRD